MYVVNVRHIQCHSVEHCFLLSLFLSFGFLRGQDWVLDILLSLGNAALNPHNPAVILELLGVDLRWFMWVTWTILRVEFCTLIDGLSYVVYSLFSFLSFGYSEKTGLWGFGCCLISVCTTLKPHSCCHYRTFQLRFMWVTQTILRVELYSLIDELSCVVYSKILGS